MSINRNTVITEVEDVIQTPKRSYNFIESIDRIQDLPISHLIGILHPSYFPLFSHFSSHLDVIGVIIEVSDLQQFNSKSDGKELIKRGIKIADSSKYLLIP